MLQARPHAIHFKRILDFGEGQVQNSFHGAKFYVRVYQMDLPRQTTVDLLRIGRGFPGSARGDWVLFR
jgi:hypothetical protein